MVASWFGGGGVGVSAHDDRNQDEEDGDDFNKFRGDQNYEVNKYMQSNIKPL